jgi:hypothetical protein
MKDLPACMAPAGELGR